MKIGEKLKYARDRAGLTGAQVKARTGIGESSLSDFESEKREPRISQLEVLGRLYGRSISFFLSEDPVDQEVVLWRERPRESPAKVREIEVQFLKLCQQYHNLETWCRAHIEYNLPEEDAPLEGYGYTDAESLARRIVEALGLGDRPGESLPRALEEVCGVMIFHMEFEPSGTAASTKSETFGAGVLLNSRNVRWRRNFDLAHELFHLLTWKSFRGGAGTGTAPTADEEQWAGCFARNLLMPIDALRTAVNTRAREGKIDYSDLLDMARQFDVSIDALLWQMHWAYNWGSKRQEQTEQLIEKAKQFVDDGEQDERRNTEPAKVPERYRALAFKALRRGEMSVGRFAEYLGVSRREAIGHLRREIDDAEEIEITAV